MRHQKFRLLLGAYTGFDFGGRASFRGGGATLPNTPEVPIWERGAPTPPPPPIPADL